MTDEILQPPAIDTPDEQGGESDIQEEMLQQPVREQCEQVSAIMIVQDARRLGMARTGVNTFMQQTYQRKEMVVVNGSGQMVTNRDHPWVREFTVDPVKYPTIGALRNYGVERATGDWMIQWDDDDHSHPHRIAFQMAHRKDGCCVVLANQIRVDVRETIICIHNDANGVAGTILFPKSTDPLWEAKYAEDPKVRREDEDLLAHFGKNKVVLDNNQTWFPGPAMHMAVHHGLNVKTREEFFGEFADPKYKGLNCSNLSEQMLKYVQAALAPHGVRIERRSTGEPSVDGSMTHE